MVTAARGIGGLIAVLSTLGLNSPATQPPVASIGSAEAAGEPQPVAYREETICRVYRVTAYCDRGITAAGVPSGVGQCAAPADVPFGSRIYIPELDRTFIVTDRTAERFRHNTVDIFIPSRDQCLLFGRNYLTCEISMPAKAIRYGSAALHGMIASLQ